ncbi:MAG: MFS transporter [Gemmatimonadaceae bacterium]|nr:MFS transporter [Gemmatimonadaceae bacterium]
MTGGRGTARAGSRYLKGRLTVLMITAFVDMLGLVMVLPLLPFYATKLGGSATIVGGLIAAFSLAQLVSAPLWGSFSDRYGRRPALLSGLILSAVAYVIFAYAGTIWMLFFSRLVQGAGGGTIGVVQAYVADVSDPKDRAKSLGWLSAVTSLGAVIGPAIGSALVQLWGRHAPGIAAAAFSLLVTLFAWEFLRESNEPATTDEHAAVEHVEGSVMWSVIAHPRDPAPRLIWIYTIAIGAFYGMAPTLPLVLQKYLPITEANVGYFVMYLGGMGFVVRSFILGRMIEWLGEANLARLGLLVLGLGLALVASIRSYTMVIVSFTLMPVGTAFLFPSVTAMLSRVVPKARRGLYMGVQQTFGGVSKVAFPIATGIAMDRLGMGAPFIVAGLLVAATLLFTSSIDEHALPPVRSAKPAR